MDAAGWRLVAPHSITPLFIIGLVFAAADAFGIGSNDVANSFATSVGSGSLSLRAACGIAVFTEFGGAMLLGDRVTKTIKGEGVAEAHKRLCLRALALHGDSAACCRARQRAAGGVTHTWLRSGVSAPSQRGCCVLCWCGSHI